jgi:hypothetical protein
MWVDSGAQLVYFSFKEPEVNNYSLWYTNCSDGDVDPKYKAKTLYEWQITNDETSEGRWVAVATLKGNVSNRAVSMIRQTQNGISAEITNARGDYSGLDLRLGSQESRFSLLCAKVNPTDISYQIDSTIYNSTDVLPSTGTENYYYVVGTKSPYDVYYWDNSEYKQNTNFIYDGIDLYKIDAASIVGAVNGSESSIAITADHIVLNGYTSNADGSFQIDENGYLIASSATLTDGTITIGDNFKVDSTGKMTATSATLTGGTIKIGDKYFTEERLKNLIDLLDVIDFSSNE